MNPNLPGLGAPQIIAVAEKVQSASDLSIPYCWTKCVTHFGEDALPYHPGEKTCYDRCVTKIWQGYDIAKAARQETESKAKTTDGMGWKWMQDLDEFYRSTPPTL
jgi:hypothetical protein